jgi:hypothetical protein
LNHSQWNEVRSGNPMFFVAVERRKAEKEPVPGEKPAGGGGAGFSAELTQPPCLSASLHP